MKNPIANLDKAFNNKIRLGIMSILAVNDWVDFKEMKQLLEVTDGNLASHITALEKINYLKIKKEFVVKKPKTSYQITEEGKSAFQKHLMALENLLHNTPINKKEKKLKEGKNIA